MFTLKGFWRLSKDIQKCSGQSVALVACGGSGEIFGLNSLTDGSHTTEADKAAALERAREIAATVATNGPLAVEAVLRTLRETPGMTEEEAFAFELPLIRSVFSSADAGEGPRVFTQKRAPDYRRR